MPYSPLYSAAFVQYTPSTPNTAFEVPDGFVADVRYAALTLSLTAVEWSLYLRDSIEAPLLCFHQETLVGALTSSSWSGRVIVPAGGYVISELSTFGGSVNMYVGGYLLRSS